MMAHAKDKIMASKPQKNAQDEPINNLAGIYWICLSVLTASSMNLIVRQLSQDIDSILIVFYRFAISSGLLIAAVILISPLRAKLQFSRPWLHVTRGALVGIATQLGFYTLASIPLATATALFFTAPIFTAIFNIYVHGEQIGPRRWAAIGVGFIGALVITNPFGASFSFGFITGTLSSLAFAAVLTLSRNVSRADGPISALFSAAVMTALLSLPLAAPILKAPTEPLSYVLIAAMVAVGFLRQFADLRAFTLADASVLAPITYLRLIFVGLGAYFIFGEIPDTPTIIGSIIVICATLYIAQREARAKKS
jgi:drug/metabolite transporter (DMT)-like permease